MAGVKARWFALGGTCFVGAILGAWFTILQSDRFAYIRNRFMVVLDHSLDPLGAGFQQSRSLLAIGSGQLTGQGYLNGTQTQASYLSLIHIYLAPTGTSLGYVFPALFVTIACGAISGLSLIHI